MPRANRHFLPGYVWHITHRCHKKEFLLRFGRDRQYWIKRLFEAKKRYQLDILNFTVTSNHIHLLIYSGADGQVVPRSMQFVAGRTAQEYNRRKHRKGAFWEDRYHATAVDTGDHLVQCLLYIDLNMVRAGAVSHPQLWDWGGYREILNPPGRYRLIARECLLNLLAVDDAALGSAYQGWLDTAMTEKKRRESVWSESVAVGGKPFLEKIREGLGIKVTGRKIEEDLQSGVHALREPATAYHHDFPHEKSCLSGENRLKWEIFPE